MKVLFPTHRLVQPVLLFTMACLPALEIRADAPPYLADLLSEIPAGITATPFFETADSKSITVDGQMGELVATWNKVNHPQFDEYLTVQVVEQTENPYGVVLHSSANPFEIEAGDWVLVSFYARTSEESPEPPAIFKGFIERGKPTWLSLGELSGVTTKDWNRYVAFGQTEEVLEKGSLILSVHLGFGPQSIDIAGVSMLRLEGSVDPTALPYTKIAYDGMAADAEWRDTAAEMIRKNRTGPLSIELVDLGGEPVAGAEVKVKLEVHDYQFGTFFNALALEKTPEGVQYRKWMRSNFNAATTPIYWADWGWQDPQRRQEYLDMASWLEEIDLPARGHVLLYPGRQFAPLELMELSEDPYAFNAMVIDHLREIVPLMKARGVREYDVINELRDLSDFTDVVGMDTVVEWFFEVRQLDSEAVLYINENSILTDGGRNKAQQDHYFNLIKWLIDQGAPLGGIGMQGHSSEAVTPPETLWDILDRFAVFGLPIRITEYDLGTRDLEGQAAYDRDFTTAIFAHPATVGMTRWGFYEPVMWRPLGAIIDADGKLKPNGEAQRKLIYGDWRTEQTGISDAGGLFTCPAFFGEYLVSVTVDGSTHQVLINFDRPGEGTSEQKVKVVVPIGGKKQ